MNEWTAYAWAAHCLRPIEETSNADVQQQVADRIVAGLLAAYELGLEHQVMPAMGRHTMSQATSPVDHSREQ